MADRLEEIVDNSRRWRDRFPGNPRPVTIEQMLVENPAKRPFIATAAKSVQITVHQRLWAQLDNFMYYMRGSENATVRNLYQNMDKRSLVLRLYRKRAVVSYKKGGKDEYILRDGRSVTEWHVGEPGYPHIDVTEYLTADELKLSALLTASSYSFYTSDGARPDPKAPRGSEPFVEWGVTIGACGSRFDWEGHMDWEECMITPTQNTIQNGYGKRADPDARQTRWRRMWAEIYGMETLPSWDEVVAARGPRFVRQQKTEAYFDTEMYASRTQLQAETILRQANRQGEEAEKKVYLSVVGLGLGMNVCADLATQQTQYAKAWTAALARLHVPNIATVAFAWITDVNFSNYMQMRFEANPHLEVLLNNRNPHTIVEKALLLVDVYPGSPNACPGNMLWLPHLGNWTGEPTKAMASLISELHNPDINLYFNDDCVRVATDQYLYDPNFLLPTNGTSNAPHGHHPQAAAAVPNAGANAGIWTWNPEGGRVSQGYVQPTSARRSSHEGEIAHARQPHAHAHAQPAQQQGGSSWEGLYKALIASNNQLRDAADKKILQLKASGDSVIKGLQYELNAAQKELRELRQVKADYICLAEKVNRRLGQPDQPFVQPKETPMDLDTGVGEESPEMSGVLVSFTANNQSSSKVKELVLNAHRLIEEEERRLELKRQEEEKREQERLQRQKEIDTANHCLRKLHESNLCAGRVHPPTDFKELLPREAQEYVGQQWKLLSALYDSCNVLIAVSQQDNSSLNRAADLLNSRDGLMHFYASCRPSEVTKFDRGIDRFLEEVGQYDDCLQQLKHQDALLDQTLAAAAVVDENLAKIQHQVQYLESKPRESEFDRIVIPELVEGLKFHANQMFAETNKIPKQITEKKTSVSRRGRELVARRKQAGANFIECFNNAIAAYKAAATEAQGAISGMKQRLNSQATSVDVLGKLNKKRDAYTADMRRYVQRAEDLEKWRPFVQTTFGDGR